jgi:Sgf11 (transcriptional regulation protein)
MLFACTVCSRKIGAGVWTRHLAKCMGIAGRRSKYESPPLAPVASRVHHSEMTFFEMVSLNCTFKQS